MLTEVFLVARGYLMQLKCNSKSGFTLIELLVVITIVSVLAALGMAVSNALILKAKQSKCASNLRQLGTGILAYTQDHYGEFPLTSHGLDAASMDQAWVYTLAPYLSDVDDVRICPADPKGPQRVEEEGTSYLLNSFLTVPQVGPFGENLGGYTNLNVITSPASTPLAFIISDKRGQGMTNDHTHSESWSSWNAVLRDIQPDRYRYGSATADATSGSSNYLFVDGHVESIPAQTVHDWIVGGHNFADPTSKPKS